VGEANRLQSMPSVGKAVNEFYENYKKATDEGRKICRIIGYPLPHVILRAHDVSYMYLPSYAATTSARHVSEKLHQVAEQKGLLREVCSYTRANVGCAFSSEAGINGADPMYTMPKPDFILVTESSCSMTFTWGEAESKIYDVPLFVIHDPYVWDEADEEDAIEEVTRQLRELIVFLEDLTERRFDWDRYRETMKVAKDTAKLRIDTMDLACQTVPSPATVFDWTALLALINYLIGLPEGREIALRVRQEVLSRIERKEGAIIPEKHRLYWDGIMMWPYLGRLAKKCAALDANAIWARYCSNSFWQWPDRINMDDPLRGNAAQVVGLHFNRNIDWLIETVTETCRRYHIDGLLVHANLTCRTMAGPQFEIMDAVSRKLGIPAVFFEGDMADESLISESQLDTRLQALIETINSRKG
jgi:benzoyl-CoA reductase/2-hydroxyglutaryl-CoA dehydratase subunit BcrC/BadD/HgdB